MQQGLGIGAVRFHRARQGQVKVRQRQCSRHEANQGATVRDLLAGRQPLVQGRGDLVDNVVDEPKSAPARFERRVTSRLVQHRGAVQLFVEPGADGLQVSPCVKIPGLGVIELQALGADDVKICGDRGVFDLNVESGTGCHNDVEFRGVRQQLQEPRLHRGVLDPVEIFQHQGKLAGSSQPCGQLMCGVVGPRCPGGPREQFGAQCHLELLPKPRGCC